MSSALDEDTRRTLDQGRETAGAMLRAAQKDLQKVFIVFLVGFLGSFYALQYYVWDFLKRVTRARMQEELGQQVEIIAQTPFDVILLQAKIGLAVGIIFAIPPFLYFSRDALKARGLWPQTPVSTWKIALVGLVSAGLFLAGVAYGYLLFFPLMFAFLANNALSAGFAPTYSIVKWAQFIFLLTVSFGLAAQMPLAITALSYAEIVPYETFRDKWRHAAVAIFVFGALFSPPDPFTQIMWAVPLLFLYGASLYLAKVVVTMRRGSERVDVGAVAGKRWNLLAGSAVVGFGAVYVFYTRGGREYVNAGLAWAGSSYRLLPLGSTLPVAPDVAVAVYGVAAAVVFAVFALLYVVYGELEKVAGPAGTGSTVGDPAAIDFETLDAAGVRAAPPEAFAALSEDEAVEQARAAMDAGDAEKARAILDRFDETPQAAEAAEHDAAAAETGTEPGSATPAGGSDEAGGMLAMVRRGHRRVDWPRRFRERWNLFLGAAVLGAALAYFSLTNGVWVWVNYEVLPYVPFVEAGSIRNVETYLGLSNRQTAVLLVSLVSAVGGVVALMAYYLQACIRAARDPAAGDLSELTPTELESLPLSVFAGMGEEEVVAEADRAREHGDIERARLILDRFDEVEAARAAAEGGVEDASTDDSAAAPGGDVGDRATRASGTFLDELTGGEKDEDDIGGYYADATFILDSITSRAFRIVAIFGIVLVAVFAWLYTGGIGDVYAQFLSQLPSVVTPQQVLEESFKVVALHPVEALIFEVKFSTLVAGLVALPVASYYAWPALRERGFVRGHRAVIFGWIGALAVGLFGGFALGYLYVAPYVISYLVADALAANMIIAYRITNFFWLIFFTTAGIGLLADVPVFMLLLNTAGVSYRTMRGRWREITVGILAFAAVFTPASITTMFLVTIPLMAAYGAGLAVLFVVTLGGRRDLARPRATDL